MKNKLILLLILCTISSTKAFSLEGKVISDGSSKKQTAESFEDVNKFTNGFFTPAAMKKEAKQEAIKDRTVRENSRGSTPPIKRLRIMYQNRNLSKDQLKQEPEVVQSKNQAILDCDEMEYFAERTELEANGNVVMFFPQNNSTIKADKVVYNQTSNLIKAFGKVVLITEGKELHGDYMQVDMNEENAFLDNPTADIFQIQARAKKGYMYGDKIIQEQGSLYVTKRTMINLKSEMFGPDLDRMFVNEKDKSYFIKEAHGERFKIKTNDIIINAKKEHDVVTLKHAEIYFNNKKVGTIPSITVHTNKNQDFIEGNYPEIGSVTNMGLYAGPGFVFDTPGGTTLKLLPILNYQGNNDTDESTIGYGAIAKFKSASNKTDIAYGTANKLFLMRGIQKLDDNLFFQYASNQYLDDWFLGFRMPKLMGELYYQDSYLNENFIGKNKDMIYTHRISAGYAQDDDTRSGHIGDLGEGGIGTARFKYMGEVAQTLYKLNEETTSPFNAKIEMIGQGSVGVYGTGDTQMIARIGPRIHTQYKWWMQDAGYFLSAYNDNSPLVMFDRYMYGRSNVYLRESVRLCKYLTLSWFGSMNLSGDTWDGNMIQENSFFFAIGPDDVKLNIGYDTVRQQSFVTMAMHLDAKGSTVEYKKMVIKNPEVLAKNKNGENKKQSFSSSAQSDDDSGIERAEVTDIQEKNEAL